MRVAPAGAWGAVSLALALGLLLAACGKKGLPQPPPGVPNTYPQPYPRE
jgi:predicted small lipoprotein YifL